MKIQQIKITHNKTKIYSLKGELIRRIEPNINKYVLNRIVCEPSIDVNILRLDDEITITWNGLLKPIRCIILGFQLNCTTNNLIDDIELIIIGKSLND